MEFYNTRMGSEFFNGTAKRIASSLERIATALESEKNSNEMREVLKKAQETASKTDTAKLCGFVLCHGFKDFSVWEFDISAKDRMAIEAILSKYETEGTSVRNCYDSQFSDLFRAEY